MMISKCPWLSWITCLIFHSHRTSNLAPATSFFPIVDRAASTEIETARFLPLPAIPLLFPAGADLQGMPEQIFRKRWQITGSGLEHHHAIFPGTVLSIKRLQLFAHRGIRCLGPREPYGNIFFVIVYLYFHAAHLPFSVSMVVLTDKYSIFKDRLQFTITCIPPFQSHCSILPRVAFSSRTVPQGSRLFFLLCTPSIDSPR